MNLKVFKKKRPIWLDEWPLPPLCSLQTQIKAKELLWYDLSCLLQHFNKPWSNFIAQTLIIITLSANFRCGKEKGDTVTTFCLPHGRPRNASPTCGGDHVWLFITLQS